MVSFISILLTHQIKIMLHFVVANNYHIIHMSIKAEMKRQPKTRLLFPDKTVNHPNCIILRHDLTFLPKKKTGNFHVCLKGENVA